MSPSLTTRLHIKNVNRNKFIFYENKTIKFRMNSIKEKLTQDPMDVGTDPHVDDSLISLYEVETNNTSHAGLQWTSSWVSSDLIRWSSRMIFVVLSAGRDTVARVVLVERVLRKEGSVVLGYLQFKVYNCMGIFLYWYF